MKLDGKTKVLELIEKNPAITDVLIGLSPEFKKLKNPLMRNTLGRFATLKHASDMTDIPLDELIRKITEVMIHSGDITDNKPEMSPEEKAKLFGEFVRIRNDQTRDILGSGLGLSILKKLADLYEGSVEVATESGKGSTFTVTLKDAEGESE